MTLQNIQNILISFEHALREGVKKKLWKSGQADRFVGAGGQPPPSLTASTCENFHDVDDRHAFGKVQLK